jgi:Putative peptidoglycan binding domain
MKCTRTARVRWPRSPGRLRSLFRVAILTALLAALGLAPWAKATPGAAPVARAPAKHALPPANPFARRGMWIWVLARSDGGDLNTIIARARRNGIGTLMIKAGDGSSPWSQFNSTVVSAFHGAGLKVCAWQYVYGTYPVAEADVGAGAARAGADCLLIDAESEYEGKYVSAQTYLTTLRQQVGARFPVALAGFPYTDFHPGFPYSVFLGPGGAQYNVPQMYWKDIGVSVEFVYAHTFAYNRMFQRQIFPLGQVYDSPPIGQIFRFRQLARAYGAPNVSWWDWQEGAPSDFYAISRGVGPIPGFVPDIAIANLKQRARGDLVVWAQEHLVSAGYPLAIDGRFSPATLSAVEQFQTAKGLPVDGLIGADTWQALLRYSPVKVSWEIRRKKVVAVTARAGQPVREPVPASASLRAKRYEIPRDLGAGRP